MARMPRPTPFMISTAVTGTGRGGEGQFVGGLSIPAVSIDPRNNFVRGAFMFADDIDKLGMSFKSWREPLEQSRDLVVIPSIQANFASQGRPAWKPLKKSTIKNRMYMGFPRGPILQRTKRLKTIATRKNIWEVTNDNSREGADMLKLRTIFFDQAVPYAQFQQLGAKLPRKRMVRSLRGSITQSGESRSTGPGGTMFERQLGTAGSFGVFGKEEAFPTSGGRLPARPYIKLTTDEEMEIYNIFYSFMSKMVDKFWPPETEGLGL
jgi:phage gpG-like protein